MRAVVQRGTGGPEVLSVEERPEPRRGQGQVLIRTEAIAVPLYETQIRAGLFPAEGDPGHEAAGVITEADDPALVGRRVVVMSFTGGAYAEYIATADFTLIPDAVTAMDAVAAAVPASVALELIRAADVKEGETVLVEAASGAIGGYLAELAAGRGAKVVVTAGTGRAVKADIVLDHNDPDWRANVPEGVDVVFASIGGPRAAELVAKMRPRGRILVYGMLSGEFPAISAADLMPRGLTLIGFGGLEAYGRQIRDAREEALDLVADGTLRPLIDRTFPLEEVREAHARVESREGQGKVVLVP